MSPANRQRVRRYAAGLVALTLWASLTGAADPDSARLQQQPLDSQTARQSIARVAASQPPASMPYQSALSFLQAQGLVNHATATWADLDTLPAPGHSLLLLDRKTPLSVQQVDQLLGWVQRGGRLLAVADALWDEASASSGDALLDRLQIRVQLSAQLPQLPPAPGDEYPSLTKLYLEDEEAPAYLGFDTQRHLDDPTGKVQSWANSNGATHLMQMAYGDGLITLVSDAQLWKDEQIQRYDNAWLLWYLNQGSQVTWLFEPMPEAHGRYVPWALAGLLVVIVGLGWIRVRHRPHRGSRLLDRRQLHFLYEQGRRCLREQGPGELLATLQRDVLQRACVHHPGFDRLAVAEQWQVLAQLSQHSTRSIGAALLPTGSQRLSDRAFVSTVAQLQSVRDNLGPMSSVARPGRNMGAAMGPVDRTVWVLLECGAWVDQPGVLQHAVQTCLQLSEAALADGFTVGLQAASCALPVRLLPQCGAEQLQRMADALAHLEPLRNAVEVPASLDTLDDEPQAYALVIMVAGFNADIERELPAALGRIAERQPVLLASLRDEALERLRQQPVRNRREALIYCGAMQRLLMRQRMHDRLAAAGVSVVDAWPGEIATESLLRYRSLRQPRG
ncbi:hypothetical protein IFT69_03485 [Pseudomonas putida]|nr:hypothetical protein [Pseudomonas putida]